MNNSVGGGLMCIWNRTSLITKKDKCTRLSRIYRVHNKIRTKRESFYEVYFAYLRAVSDGERSFTDDQFRSGRLALKSARAPRQDRVHTKIIHGCESSSLATKCSK